MTDQYVPGTCNIGAEEIALRRRDQAVRARHSRFADADGG
jgi:hypothetical protein